MEKIKIEHAAIKIWIDAQLSTIIAKGLREDFGFDANSLKFLGLRDSDDIVIFRAARLANAIIIKKILTLNYYRT